MKTFEEIKQLPRLKIIECGEDGGCGEIYVLPDKRPYGSVVWSNGGGWEHVSISPYNHRLTPTWDIMCMLKDMFFYEEETCVQFHPKKSEYVNLMENCLHIWRPTDGSLEMPPKVFV